MSARLVFIILNVLDLIWSMIKARIAKIQRSKPLPEEVSDIYDKDRYQTFLNYKSDKKRIFFIKKLIQFIIDTVVILSPIFAWIEKISNKNVYVISFITVVLLMLIDEIVGMPFRYYNIFVIREKYKLNKMNLKEFIKDNIVGIITQLLVVTVVLEVFTALITELDDFAMTYNLSYFKGFLVCLAIAAAFFVFVVIMVVIQIIALRIQYKFTPLEEGDLKNKINALQESSKKKVKRIYVYNESKKSVSKNAFLLKYLFYREFGIADNFLNENSERELLAVLSHEIGHLKHKKNILDYSKYVVLVLFLICLWIYLVMPDTVPQEISFFEWINRSFNVIVPNSYIIFSMLLGIGRPVFALFGIFGNYRQRKEEYEADQEAVKNGYGEELIATFKRMSSDELIDINPHPLMVILYHDHPTINQRIVAIRKASEGNT